MDINETLDSDYSSDLNLTGEIKGYLKETAKWAKFIAIIGFIGIGFMVIFSLGVGFFMGSMGDELGGAMPFPPALLSFFYLFFALIAVIPVFYLFRFATNMQTALKRNDEQALVDSFRYLKSHYKFYGIFMAIMLGFYALAFVGALIGGAGAMFM